MPVVLPALLYRSRRCFMARFYDKMVWSEKARRLYAHVLLIVLLLFHYVYTSGHPGEFGIVILAALFYPSARVMSEKTDIRKFLEWLECPGALADSYHSIITRGCHDNADNGNLKLSAHYESSKTE